MAKLPTKDYSPSQDDLNEIIGIILHAPTPFNLGHGDYNRAAFTAMLEQFRLDLEPLLPTSSQHEKAELGPPQAYQIGPAAGVTWDAIIACLQQADYFIHSTADYIAWGGFALAAGRLWRQHLRELRPEYGLSEREAAIFPRRLIEGMCLKDLQDRFGITGRVNLHGHSRDSYYVDGRRPTACSIHTIAIRMGGKGYFYIVSGQGKVIENFLLDGTKIIPLELPVWFPHPD